MLANFWDSQFWLSNSDQNKLKCSFIEEELKCVIFSSEALGALGLDGFSFLFYQHFF
jgi:hypothetical protein